MPDYTGALNKIDQVMVRLIDDPILLQTMCLVEKIPCKSQDTIGIDVKHQPPSIRYNPNFINSIHVDQLEAIIVSEGFKILLRHCTTRLKNPKIVSSLASAVTVNQFLKPHMLLDDEINKHLPMPDKYKLNPNEYFESYWSTLNDRYDELKKQIEKMFSNKSGKGDDKGQGQSGGQNKTDKLDENKDSKGFKEYKNSDEAMKEYANPQGTGINGWGDNDLLDADVQNMIENNKHSKDGWGKYTGDFMAAIIAANEPKISYKEILKKFNKSVLSMKTTTSRMKLNRRYDLKSPGYRRLNNTKIVFAIDSSGSMTDNILSEGFAVVNACLRHAEVTYMLFDTEIKQIETNLKRAKTEFKVIGRGGTDFQQVIDYSNKMKADGLIIFTDGAAPAPSQPRKKSKVLWLLTDEKQEPPVSWGFKAHLKLNESH